MTGSKDAMSTMLLLTLGAMAGSGVHRAMGQTPVNVPGALIIHSDPTVQYSSDMQPCELMTLASCEDAVATAPADGQYHILSVYAAFGDSAVVRLAGCTFGIDYDPNQIIIDGFGRCSTLEIAESGWPAADTSTSLVFAPVAESTLIPLYWFVAYVYANTSGHFSLTRGNVTGEVFADDSVPAVLQTAEALGAFGFGVDGEHTCPVGDFDTNDPVPYSVQFLDARTGDPLAGQRVEVEEQFLYRRCCHVTIHDCHNGCEDTVYLTYRGAVTNASGVATVTETPPVECHSVGECDYVTRRHLGWTGNGRVLDEAEGGVSSTWNARSGGASTVWADPDRDIALRFLPVLHRHKYLENIDGLGDAASALDASQLQGYTVTQSGQRDWNMEFDMPPYSHEDGCEYSTLAEDSRLRTNSIGQYWIADLPDTLRTHGAPDGQRPLYYHVFSVGPGAAVVQYWYWLNANILEDFTIDEHYSHEGDWEHVAVALDWDVQTENWVPSAVTFYKHECFTSFDADECWWSATSETEYFSLQKGFDGGHTHLHVWLAARAHGSYNRYELMHMTDTYIGDFWDHADYNRTDQARGDHSFWRYDKVVDLGEYWWTTPCGYDAYYKGGPHEWMKLAGFWGENLAEGWGFSWSSPGPQTPAAKSRRWHEWEADFGAGGTCEDVTIPWVVHDEYLGRYMTCGGQTVPEPVSFLLPVWVDEENPDPNPACDFVIRCSGTVTVGGETVLRFAAPIVTLGGQDYFAFERGDFAGAGSAEIELEVHMDPSNKFADGLIVEFEEECVPLDVTSQPGGINGGVKLSRSVIRLSEIVEVRAAQSAIAVDVYSVAGRRVGHVSTKSRDGEWLGVLEARDLDVGVYWVRAVEEGGSASVARIVVVP